MTTIFIFAAVFGAVILLLQIVLGMLSIEGIHAGVPHDVTHDTSHDTHHEHQNGRSSLNMKSVRGLSAALMMYGLTGGYLTSVGVSPILANAAGFGVGMLFNLLTAWVFSKFGQVESDGTPRRESAIGKFARAYTTIPASNQPPYTGMIQVSTDSGIIEMPASSKQEIEIGQRVYVANVQGGVAEVEEVVTAG